MKTERKESPPLISELNVRIENIEKLLERIFRELVVENKLSLLEAKVAAVLACSVHDPSVPVERKLVEVEKGLFVRVNCRIPEKGGDENGPRN